MLILIRNSEEKRREIQLTADPKIFRSRDLHYRTVSPGGFQAGGEGVVWRVRSVLVLFREIEIVKPLAGRFV